MEVGAIFLPGYAEDLKLLIPQIRYHVIHTRFLGSDSWDSENLIREVRPYVQDAVFATDYHIDPSNPAWARFSQAYSTEFKHSPDKVATLTYDATNMILKGLKEGRTGGVQMREYLNDVNDYKGVSSLITFKGTERASGGVAVYSIDGHKIWSAEHEIGKDDSK